MGENYQDPAFTTPKNVMFVSRFCNNFEQMYDIPKKIVEEILIFARFTTLQSMLCVLLIFILCFQPNG